MTLENVFQLVKKFFGYLMLTLDKLLTLVVDRRMFIYVASLLMMFGLLPWSADQLETANQALVDAILLVSQAVDAVFGLIMLLYSFTKREPSGYLYGQRRMDYLTSLKEN